MSGIDFEDATEDRRCRPPLSERHAVASELQELGLLVKDLDEGLVDFPALSGDEEVLLCWQLGEDEVAYWHTVDDGFAGRKHLPIE